MLPTKTHDESSAVYGAELSQKGEERMARLRALGIAPTEDELFQAGLKSYERLIADLGEAEAANSVKH
jgi:hypothetical protein